jgi:hypothetical protein
MTDPFLAGLDDPNENKPFSGEPSMLARQPLPILDESATLVPPAIARPRDLCAIDIRPDEYSRALELAKEIDATYAERGDDNYAGEVLDGVERFRVGYVGEFVFDRWARQFTDCVKMDPRGTTNDGKSHPPDFKFYRPGREPLTLDVKTQGKVAHQWATILAKQPLKAKLYCFVRLDEPRNVARIMGAEWLQYVKQWELRDFGRGLPARAKRYELLNADGDALRAFFEKKV